MGVLGPGAVVEADVWCADDFEAESDDGGGDSGAAGGGDGLVEVDLFGAEEVAEFVGGFEAAVFDEFGEGDAGGSGHVAGAYAGAWLGCCAVEAGGGAGVEDLLVVGDFFFELGEVFYGFGVEGCVEGGWCAVDGAGFDGEIVLGPGAEASVEDVDVLGAEGAEGPPGSGSGEDALLFVDDDGHVVADAESGHAAGKVFGCGEHVGEWRPVVGEFLDVEEESAGDVPG